jgi:hypothetical protein
MEKRNHIGNHGRSETSASSELIRKLIADAACAYKPDGERKCGRRHEQMEAGNSISLFEARVGLELRGVICNKCLPLIGEAGGDLTTYSFVPIAEAVGQIVFFSRSNHHSDNGGGGGKKSDNNHEPKSNDKPNTNRGKDDRRERAERKDSAAQQKPAKAEAPKAEPRHHKPGEKIRPKVEALNDDEYLAWFKLVACRAANRRVKIIHLLAWTFIGRKLLRAIDLEECITRVTKDELATVAQADQIARARSAAGQLRLISSERAA